MHDTKEFLEKVAFIGALARGIAAPFKWFGGKVMAQAAKHPFSTALTGLGTYSQGSELLGGARDAIGGALASSPGARPVFGGFGNPFQKAAADTAQVEREVSTHMLEGMHPIQGAKYALLAFSKNPELTVKIASGCLQAAVKLAMKDYADLAKLARVQGLDIPDESVDQTTRDMVNRTVEFKRADKTSVKLADYMLARHFPTFYKHAEGRHAFLCFACLPDVMTKTSAFRMSPSTFERMNIPLAATLAIGAGALGLHSLASGAKNKMNEVMSYGQVVEMDPELAQFPAAKVKSALKDLHAMAPDVMARPTMAAHLVRQVVTAPPGGVSIDFAEKLTKAQEKMDPGTFDRAVKVLGPASSVVGNVLHFF